MIGLLPVAYDTSGISSYSHVVNLVSKHAFPKIRTLPKFRVLLIWQSVMSRIVRCSENIIGSRLYSSSRAVWLCVARIIMYVFMRHKADKENEARVRYFLVR